MQDPSENSPAPARHEDEHDDRSASGKNVAAPAVASAGGSSDEPSADITLSTTGRARQLTVLAVGVVLTVLLIVIVLNIGSPAIDPDAIAGDQRDGDPVELISPAPLGEQELTDSASMRDLTISDMTVAGGWIQITDEQGALAQQYRFDQLDPDPDKGPGWAQLTRPEAELFLSHNRVVVLTGDQALAYMPSRALESGTLTGNVTIALYELEAQRSIVPGRDVATLTIQTELAEFDGLLGEVYAPGAIRIDSAQLALPGHELRVLFNDLQQQLSLRISSVDFIELRAGSVEASDGERGQEAATAPSEAGQPDALRPGSRAVDRDRVYQLTLTDNVRVIQHAVDGSQEMRGELLTAVFSTEAQGLGGAFASALRGHSLAAGRADDSRAGQTAALSVPQALLATVIAAPRHSRSEVVAEPGQIVITLDGSLTLNPWATAMRTESETGLADADDVLLTVTGSPVVLRDTVDDAEATCASFVYQRIADRFEMYGAAEHAVVIRSPQVTAEGERFVLARQDGMAEFIGAGWLTPQDARPARPDGRSEGGQQDALGQLVRELHITWQEGVNLKFSPARGGSGIGELREVHFAGEVAVQSQDGDIYSETLVLELTTDALGDPAPQRMLARGGVKTRDDMRTMWADDLTVDFQQIDPAEIADRDRDETQDITMRISERTMLRHLHARGDVQILLSDGSRAFADELIGDGLAEKLTLRGEQVVIASGRMLIDRGRIIEFDARDESGLWVGPGQLSFYNQAISTDADERIERPVINHEQSPPVVRARWNTSLTYDNKANDGAGKVALQGDVFAESLPDPLQYNRLEGEEVILDFAFHASDEERTQDSETARGGTDFGLSDRQLERFTAKRNARLENRTWRHEDRSDRPRVFYVAGPHVQYNDRTFESRVIGAGELLIRDTWIDPETQGQILQPGDRGAARIEDASEGAFRGKGTSLFRWRDELSMTIDPALANAYRIAMRGDVSAIHRDINAETATLTGQEVDVALVQVSSAEREFARGSNLDLGGAFDLRRIVGRGAIAVEARRHTVMCEQFAYDLMTGIAEATAQSGNRVSVLTAGSPHPLQAASILWDMKRDIITLQRGTGGG